MSWTRIECNKCGYLLIHCKCKSIYERAIETFGYDHQVDLLLEEFSELQKELLKQRRFKEVQRRELIIEELVDVEIMLAQLKTTIDPQLIEEKRKAKLERLEQLINNHKK